MKSSKVKRREESGIKLISKFQRLSRNIFPKKLKEYITVNDQKNYQNPWLVNLIIHLIVIVNLYSYIFHNILLL